MFRSLLQQRVVKDPGWGKWADGSDVLFEGSTAAGQNVTQSSSLNLVTVYGCVSFISDLISTLPYGVFRDGQDGPEKITAPGWIEQPNDEADWVTFAGQVVSSWLLDGNIFALPLRRNTSVYEVLLPAPTSVQVTRERAGGNRMWSIDGIPWTSELVHVPAFMRAGDLRGMSPIEQARQAIGLGLGATDFGARFFGQGAVTSGVIETPGKLSEGAADRIRESWGTKHSGARVHLPGVLTEGAQWKATQLTNEQAQFLETRNYQAAEIAGQIFRVDPSELGLAVNGTSLTYQNIESRGIRLVQITLLPWIVRLERLITKLLPRPQYFKLNVAGLLRADLKTRYDSYRVALGPNVPFLDVDEVRELEERGPMTDPPVSDTPEPPVEGQ